MVYELLFMKEKRCRCAMNDLLRKKESIIWWCCTCLFFLRLYCPRYFITIINGVKKNIIVYRKFFQPNSSFG